MLSSRNDVIIENTVQTVFMKGNLMDLYRKEENSWRNFCGDLDFKSVSLGRTEARLDWRNGRSFSGDAHFRLYFPKKGKFHLLYFSETWSIIPGFRYLIPPTIPFRFEGVVPSDHAWIHFYSKQLEKIPYFIRPAAIPVNPENDFSEFQTFAETVRQSKTIFDAEEVRHRLTRLVLPFVEQAQISAPERTERYAFFANVIEYIDEHLTDEIRIHELEQIAQLNRAEFSAQFRKTYGIPPKQYITLRRISRAKYLLLRTDLSIKEILYQAGFENEQVFYRLFKKHTGSTPLRYRENHI